MFLRRQTLSAILFLIFSVTGFGQNNLSVNYGGDYGVANNLNICGEADTISVRVQLAGGSNLNRSNIEANIHLFKGVEFVNLISAETSPGVGLLNNSDPNNPTLSLPDLSPTGTGFVDIVFSAKANCNFLDTLEMNEQALVFDTWEFNYSLGGTNNISESDNLSEYRDAFSIPFFTMEIEPRDNPVKVGECFNRELKITNTSLGAYVTEMTYEVTQEIGVIVDDILVNGTSVNFTSTPAGVNANKLTITLDETVFQQNQNSQGGNGNSDGRFDSGEFLTITEVLCFQSCELGRSSTHTAKWGCGNDFCTEINAVDFITTGLGNPTPNVQVVQNVDPGYCAMGSSTLRFSNIGYEDNLGFGAMFDVTVGIGLSGSFELDMNGYTISGMEIAGQNLTGFNALNALDNHPIFANDPDGAGGLDDIDNDGFYDDLPVGESFDVTAFVSFDCTDAATISHPDSCFNNFSTSFNGRIDYTNSCDKRDLRLQNSYYRPTNSNSGFENFTDPDAFMGLGTFTVRHIEQRSIRSFDFDCPGGGQLVAKVVLPQGITPDLSQTHLIKNELTPFVLNSSFQNGDTLNLVFGGPLLNFLSGTYELVLELQADCTADLGATEFPLIFEFQCPDCACSHIWFCDELQGPWLHATNPPCPDDVLRDCPVGIQTGSFDVERTTFGFTDNTYTTRFPKADANRHVAIPCDSVKMTVTNVVGDMPLTSDIGVVITHDNPDNSDNSDETFIFTDGVLEIIKNGVKTTANLSLADLSVSSIDKTKELRFDFTRILQDLNITLNPGDSVNFSGNFSINPDGPIPFQFRGVPNFRAFGYALQNGEPVYCDKFGENFTLGKTNSVFDFPNNIDFPKGCQDGNLEYRLITVNNGFADFFGDEIRPATKIDSVLINFETSIFDAFEGGTVEVLVPGHPIFGSNYFPIRPLSDFTDGRYVAVFDTLDYVPALNETGNTNFSLRVNLTPTCQSFVASEDGDNRYAFNSKMTFHDRYYASFIGDGSCTQVRNEAINQEIEYSIPPDLELSPVTNTNFTLFGDTAVWIVEICNQSANSDAGLTWLAIENPNNAIEVVAMADVTNSANIKTLTVEQYGTNYFAIADGVLRGSGGNTVEDICNVIEIKALVQVCGTSVLTARTGWNCEAFPSDWNPDLYAPCTDRTIPLSVSTRDPRLEADIVDQPDTEPEICDTTTISILLKNVDLGAVFDLKTVLTIPPTGATLVPGSVEIAYPPTAPFQPALGDPILASTDLRGQNYEYDGFGLLHSYLENEGLAGFNQFSPSDSNQMKIRYKFLTDCDFVSGSLAFFSFQGTKGCQQPSNFEAGETLPIYLNGATPDPNKLFQIDFAGNPMLVSNSSDLEILVSNLTNTPSDANDKIRITLPENVNYQAGTSIGISPSSWIPGEPTIDNIGGFEELIWTLPLGLSLNEEAQIRFTVSTPQFDCNSPDQRVKLATVSQTVLMCQSMGAPCDIQVINSTGGDDFIVLPVGETLILDDVSLESACNLSEEIVHASFNFSASGFEFNSEQIVLSYFFDQNGNAEFDNGELIFSTIKTAPASGNSWTISDTLNVPVDQICGLGIFINPDDLPICQRADFLLPLPILRNAGTANPICNDDINLVANLGINNCQSANYTYSWNAIAPAQNAMLSALNIANPVFTTQNQSGAQQFQFTLETTRSGCVSTTDTITILSGDPITATVVSPVFIPLGNSDFLQASATGGIPPYNYNWTPATGLSRTDIANPSANPDVDTQYTLTVTDSLGCTDQAIVRVVVDNPIQGEVSFADTSVCFGTDIQLFASGGTNYRWIANPNNLAPGTLSNFNIAEPLFENGVAGATYEFEVIISDSNSPGFADTAAVVIRIGIPIGINLPAQQTILAGESIDLDPIVSGGILPLTFEWLPATDLSSSNTQNTIATPTESRNYFFIVTDDYFCQETAEILIEVRDSIIGEVNFSDTTICEGATLPIIASGGNNYEWIADSANPTQGGLTANNISNPIFENGIAGKTYRYQVLVSDNRFASNVDTVSISIFINELPIAEAGRDVNLCRGESIDLSGSATGGAGNYTFDWSGSTGGSATTNVSPTTSQFFYLTVTDGNGCQNIDSVFVNVTVCPCDLPEVTNISIQNATCGNADGSAKVEVAGDLSDFRFNWAPTGTTLTPNHRIEMVASRYLLVIAKATDSRCSIEVEIAIENQDGPQVDVTTTAATCSSSNGSATLMPTTFSYVWGDGDNRNSRDDLAAGIYFVTVTNPTDTLCSNVIMVEIEEENPLVADVIVNTQPTCGERNGSVTIQISGSSGPFSYSWLGGTDTRNDLTAGVHLVTVTDDSGCELEVVFSLQEVAPDANVLVNSENNPSCIGADDGRIDFTINFDPLFNFPADTFITDGFNNFTNGNLPEGNYCLEIQDANGCIAGRDCFSITDPEPIIIVATAFEKCQNPGIITLDISGGTAPYSFDWEDIPNDSIEPQNRMGLINGGVYNVTVSDDNACSATATVNVDSCGQCFIISAKDTLLFQAAACDSLYEFCLPVAFQQALNLEIIDNATNTIRFNELVPCDLTTVLRYSFKDLLTGPYVLQNWVINGGSPITGNFNDLQELVDLMNQFDPDGKWVLDMDSSNALISGGDMSNIYSDITVNTNGFLTTHSSITGSLVGGYSILLDTGFHRLVISDTAQGCMDTVLTNIVCAATDTIFVDLIIGGIDTTICLDDSDLLGSIDTFYNNCPDGSFVNYEFLNDTSCVRISGDSVGVELACLVVCDADTICDTTFVVITVSEQRPPPKIFTDTIGVGQMVTICCDTPQVRLDNPIDTIYNICEDSSGTAVLFETDTLTNCLTYLGLEEGVESACIVFCDSLGVCDTVNFIITVEKLDTIIRDTILLKVDSVTYCFPLPPLGVSIDQIYDDCPQLNGNDVTFIIDTINMNLCVTYTGINVGQDTACIVLVGSNGVSFRTTFIIDVVTPMPETFCDTIFDGESKSKNLDTSEIGDDIFYSSIDCDGLGFAEFFINENTNTIEYTGLAPGRDSACIIYCDERGACDTLNLCITVLPFVDAPIANCDSNLVTDKNVNLIIKINANDSLFGNTGHPRIINEPDFGMAFVNPDTTITYVPGENESCDVFDNFDYEVCNEFNGVRMCDTACVIVFVNCIDIVIFTAVSPNLDGVNDYFYIGGIEDKPDNNLKVYNRWGNLVLDQDSYDNTWEGTFNGKELPDGSYYYIFEVMDEGTMRTFRGYLEIYR